MINNKNGQIMGIVFFIAILFLLLLGGMLLAFGGSAIGWVADEVVPVVKEIGQVGNTNVTQIAEIALDPVHDIINSFSWMSGVLYAITLFGLFGLAFAFRITGDKWLIGFFIVCMLMLVIGAILISNIYEDFYDDSNEVGISLKEYTILSWFILYSPMVVCVVGFIAGIIMFTSEEEGYT